MNAIENFFELPRDILSVIYEFDSTFKNVFSTEESRLDIRRMSQKIKQTPEYIKDFIRSELVSIPGLTSVGPEWGYVSRNPFFWILDENLTFGSEFKIVLHPKDERYIKYQIMRQDDDCIIDLDDFDGFICNEEQHSHIMSTSDILDENDERMYSLDGLWMKVSRVDIEAGIYLHTVISVINHYESDDEDDYDYPEISIYDGFSGYGFDF